MNLKAFMAILGRDLRITGRNRMELCLPLVFYVLVVSLIPLGISPNSNTLAIIAPGIIWIAALLATLLSLDRLFRTDFDDGSLELFLLSPVPLPILVGAKILAHWISTGLPLLLISPLLALFLALPDSALPALIASLALGTPVLSLIGGIGVALTIGLRRGGALLALLVLPLYIPVLIFAANAVAAASDGLPVTGQLYMLAAFLVLSMSLAPLAAAGALRITAS